MSAEDRVRLEAYADRMMQRVRHEVAHLSGDDSECERELAADGCRGLYGQVELEDGEFYLGSDDVSVETLRDDDGYPAHIRACWGLGGPSVFLTRDWHGDRLGVSWGFDSTVRTGPEVRELLDAYAEMLA